MKKSTGKLATSNAAQVRRARQIVEGLGLEIATPDEARKILFSKAEARSASEIASRVPSRAEQPAKQACRGVGCMQVPGRYFDPDSLSPAQDEGLGSGWNIE